MGSGPGSTTSLLGCYISPISSPICKMTGEWVEALGLERAFHLWHSEHLWAKGPAGCASLALQVNAAALRHSFRWG